MIRVAFVALALAVVGCAVDVGELPSAPQLCPQAAACTALDVDVELLALDGEGGCGGRR